MSTTRGNDVYIAIKPQVDLKTPVKDTTLVTGDYIGFESESLAGGRETVTAATIRRSAMTRRGSTGNGTQTVGGDLNLTGSQLILDKMLPLATHTASETKWYVSSNGVESLAGTQDGLTAGSYQKVTMTPTEFTVPTDAAAGVKRRRYSLVDGGRLQPFTTFVGMAGGNAQEGNFSRVFAGCKVGSLSLNTRVNEFLKVATRIEGVEKILQDGVRTPTYPLDEVEYSYLFTGSSVKIKTGGMATLGELGVMSADLQMNHNLGLDDFVLGRVTRQSLDEGETEVTGSFEMSMGADALSGSVLNGKSSLYNDRAFLERLNLEAKYASLQLMFTDWTREIVEGETVAGSTTAQLKLAAASVSVQEGDEVSVSGVKVRVASVNATNKTIDLASPLATAPAAGVQVIIPSHLRVSLPFIRLDEPQFQVSDRGNIKGSAGYKAYDTVIFDHVYKL